MWSLGFPFTLTKKMGGRAEFVNKVVFANKNSNFTPYLLNYFTSYLQTLKLENSQWRETLWM